MVFTVFDRPGLYAMMDKYYETGQANYFTRSSNILPGTDATNKHRGILPTDEQTVDIRAAMPYYSDQIPPKSLGLSSASC